MTTSVIAGPDGQQVVVGNVTFTREGNVWIITASDGSIINYASFDVLPFETIRFLQPSQLSTVLNRINSAAPTMIEGRIEANGRVFFVNPAGVIFGQGAVVNVGGLFAAAGNISDKDFQAGRYNFTGNEGRVENHGSINANTVALIGKQVANYGTIVASQGTIVLAAGRDVFVGQEGSQVYVQIPTDNGAADASVENYGTLQAQEGRVLMSAGDAAGMAIFNSGLIQAAAIDIEGQGTGEVHIAGTLDASNQTGVGGSIVVTGERVGLFSANVDASGRDGGGTIAIGGGLSGSAPDAQGNMRTADYVYVSADSVVRSDAWGNGNGGLITFWGTDAARIAGGVYARGGLLGGNGGFIETSGGYIALAAAPDARARVAGGQAGMWLIDPNNLLVVAGAGNTNINAADPFATTNDTASLGVDLIVTALGAGTAVSISTATGGTNLQNGDITFDTNVVLNYAGAGTASLTLNAHNDIIFSTGSGITATGAGALNVTLNANSDAAGGGNVSFLGTNAFTTNLGNFVVGANVVDTSFTGTVSITTGGGGISFNNSGNVTLSAGTTLDIGAGTLAVANSVGTLTTNGATITMTAGGNANIGAVTLGSNLTLGVGTVTFSGAIAGGAFSIDTSTAASTVFNAGVTAASITAGVTTFGAGAGTIATTTTQSYGATTLLGSTVFTGTTAAFGAITGGGFDLTTTGITTSTTFNGNITNIGTLTSGTTILGAAVTVTGTNATFGGLTGAFALDTTGVTTLTTFNGAVNITSLASGTTTIGAAAATMATTTSQSYTALTLLGNTVFTGTTAAFGAITGGGFNLTTTGITTSTTFNANITNIGTLASGTTILGAGVTVTGTNATFGGLTGAFALDTTGVTLTTFNGAVSIGSLASGTTTIGAAAATIATTTTQSYTAISLLGNTVFTGTTAAFGAVTGGGVNMTTTGVTTSTTFNGNITNIGTLTSGITILGANVTVTGSSASFGAITGATFNLDTSALAGSTTLNADVTNIGTLTTGAITLGGNVTVTGTNATFGAITGATFNLDTSALTGATTLNGNVTNIGTLTAGATTLGGNVTVTGTNAIFGAITGATFNLDTSALTGATTLNGNVTNIGTLTAGATTLGGNVTVTGTNAIFGAITGATFNLDTSALAGATTLNANVTNIGTLTAGATTLGGNVTVTGANAIFGAITGATFNLDTSALTGTTTLNANVTNIGTLTTGTTTLGGNVTVTGTNASFGGLTGAFDLDTSGVTTLTTFNANVSIASINSGITNIATTLVATTGNQTYGVTTLSGGTVTLTGGAIVFNGTVDGTSTVTPTALTTTGATSTTFNGQVGQTAPGTLASITSGVTTFGALVTNVSTVAQQTYGDTTLTAASIAFTGTTVTFGGSLNGAAAGVTALDTSGATSTVFNGQVGQGFALLSINSGATTFGPSTSNVSTTGTQTYGNLTLTSATVNLAGGAITFNGTIDGTVANTTALDTTGATSTTFNGAVGTLFTLASINSTATTINNTSIATGGDQTYGGATTLGGVAVTLTGGIVTFNGTLDGAVLATTGLNSSGATSTVFNGAVGTLATLASITTGATTFGAGATSVTTSGAQAYGDATTAGVLTLTGVGVSFTGTLGTSGGLLTVAAGAATATFTGLVTLGSDLTVTATDANFNAIEGGASLDTTGVTNLTTFAGTVGSVTPLTALSTGNARILGSIIQTTGLQNYAGTLLVSANTVLSAGEIDFAGNVTTDGAFTLGLQNSSAAGNIIVGDTNNATGDLDLTAAELAFIQPGLTSITIGSAAQTGTTTIAADVAFNTSVLFVTDVTGSTLISGGNITSTGTVTFTSDVTSSGGARSVTGTAVTFDRTLTTGGGLFTVAAGAGTATFTGAVNIAGASLTVTGANATFTSTVDGANTLDTSGVTTLTTFNGLVGNGAALTAINSGITAINAASVMATTATFGNTTLGAPAVTFTGTTLTFNGTLGGASDLTSTAMTTTVFNGAVGGLLSITSGVTTFGAGATSVTTTGAQSYGNATTAGALTLTGVGVTFTGTLGTAGGLLTVASGAGNATFTGAITLASGLTVTGTNATFAAIDGTAALDTSGVTTLTTFGGIVGGATALASINSGTTAIATSGITTVGTQTYAGVVTFSNAATTMSASTYLFRGSLVTDGTPRSLSLLSTGTASVTLPLFRFQGSIGSLGARFANVTLGGDLGTVPLFSTIVFASAFDPGTGLANVTSVQGALTDFGIFADNITTGVNQKVLALGNLTLDVTNSVTVGDLTAFGNITVNAPGGINIRSRAPSTLLNADGTTQIDTGADWIAGGNISSTGAVTVTGGEFSLGLGGAATGSVAGQATKVITLTALAFQDLGAGGTGNSNNLLGLDLSTSITTNQPPIAGLNPSVQLELSEDVVPLTEDAAKFLLTIEIALGDELSVSEILDAQVGRALYDDRPTPNGEASDAGFNDENGHSYKISRSRLSKEALDPAIQAYGELFGTEQAAADGGVRYSAQDDEAKLAKIRADVESSFNEYLKQAGTPDGVGYRRFLEAHEGDRTDCRDTLQTLVRMSVLFERLDQIGLSSIELEKPKNVIAGKLRSSDANEAMTPRLLRDAARGVAAPQVSMSIGR